MVLAVARRYMALRCENLQELSLLTGDRGVHTFSPPLRVEVIYRTVGFCSALWHVAAREPKQTLDSSILLSIQILASKCHKEIHLREAGTGRTERTLTEHPDFSKSFIDGYSQQGVAMAPSIYGISLQKRLYSAPPVSSAQMVRYSPVVVKTPRYGVQQPENSCEELTGTDNIKSVSFSPESNSPVEAPTILPWDPATTEKNIRFWRHHVDDVICQSRRKDTRQFKFAPYDSLLEYNHMATEKNAYRKPRPACDGECKTST